MAHTFRYEESPPRAESGAALTAAPFTYKFVTIFYVGALTTHSVCYEMPL